VVIGFSHVQLVVSDVEASARWYEQVLGVEQFVAGEFGGGRYIGLRHRAAGFVVGLQTGPGAGQAAMVDHVSFTVGSREELVEHRDAAASAGLDVGDVFEEAASWNLRLRDPDGLAIELTAAKPRTR